MAKSVPASTGRKRSWRYDARRDELIDAALRTVADFGLARTSLRDIAQNSQFSHGVLHYYFADRDELVAACLDRYFESVLDGIRTRLATDPTPAGVVDAYVATCQRVLTDELGPVRMWFDVRSQSLFDPSLRDMVGRVEARVALEFGRAIDHYAAVAGRVRRSAAHLASALWDGVWRQQVARAVAGNAPGDDELRQTVQAFLDLVTDSERPAAPPQRGAGRGGATCGR